MSVEAPERIWVTREDMAQSWPGAYKVFRASDLEHPDCPEYVRAEKLEELAADAHEWKERVQYLSKCIDEKSAEEDRLKAALAEAKRENEALREALQMIANIELSFISECRGIASEALARNAGGNDAR